MKILLLPLFFLILLAPSCTQKPAKNGEEKPKDEDTIKLSKLSESPAYSDAKLMKKSFENNVTEDGKHAIAYDFTVENYELGIQTSDSETKNIANSEKGQHIHFIVNNGPYAAHYMNQISSTIDTGNYVVLAFLSRSYHESVKNKNAFFIENITLGEVEKKEVDTTKPHIFYSRPKGVYKNDEIANVLLDFYLVNCTLSADGYKVVATINGSEFVIEEWAAYTIENLSLGENTIELALYDSNMNLVDSPFNPVKRTIVLKKDKTE